MTFGGEQRQNGSPENQHCANLPHLKEHTFHGIYSSLSQLVPVAVVPTVKRHVNSECEGLSAQRGGQ